MNIEAFLTPARFEIYNLREDGYNTREISIKLNKSRQSIGQITADLRKVLRQHGYNMDSIHWPKVSDRWNTPILAHLHCIHCTILLKRSGGYEGTVCNSCKSKGLS